MQYFWREIHLWEDMTILRGGRRLATKINITFLVGIDVFNIFHLTIFFEKTNIFQNNVFLQILSYRLLPFHTFLEVENFIMRSILYEECMLKKWSSRAFIFGKIFYLKPLNANFTSHLHPKNYKKNFLDFSHTQPSDAAIRSF